jgi:hypothetical protein
MSGEIQAREMLRRAHADREKAHAALDHTTAALERAEKVLASIVAAQEAHDAEARAAAETRTEKLLVAIKSGEDAGLVGDDRVVAELLVRSNVDAAQRVAAERAAAQLKVELFEAERFAERTEQAVAEAAKGVLLDEAEKIAAEFARLADSAATLRRRLGAELGIVGKVAGTAWPRSELVGRAIAANGEDGWGPERRIEAELVNRAWDEFRASLLRGDAGMVLDFSEISADRIKELAEVGLRAQVEAAYHRAPASPPATGVGADDDDDPQSVVAWLRECEIVERVA